jgi:peptide/nickel transport system substrate-binding protein
VLHVSLLRCWKEDASSHALPVLFFLVIALCLTTGCHHTAPAPGTVTVLIESSPSTLDPRIATDAQGARIAALIFDSLIRKDEHFNLQPGLASSWQQPDPLTLIFHLRPGIHFHDGRLLTSADVAWTLRSMLDGTVISPKTSHLSAIDTIDTPDPLTVILHLSHPDNGVLWNLTDGLSGIVPAGSGRELSAHPIGTGPFRYVSQVDDKEVVLERNPEYWEMPPSIRRAVFAVVPDATTRALELEKAADHSAVIAINSLTADMVHALQSRPGLAVEVSPGTILNYINMNVSEPPLQDRRVRQAIACSIDRPAILHALFRDQARLANSLLPAEHWAAAADPAPCAHDLARAERLLDAAGYPPDAAGIRLRVSMKTSTDETTRLLAAILQAQMRQAGIALDLRSYEFATFFADISRGAFQMYALRWIGSNEDPDIYRATLATTNMPPHGDNRGRYSNPALDALLAHAAATPDQTSRRADYLAVQQILANDTPEINLWYLDNVLVHTQQVTNLHSTPSGSYDFLRWARTTD